MSSPRRGRCKVILGGETVAETHRARFLFETRLPTRYYIPHEDVRMDLFVPSDKATACPYKGRARYWSANIGDQLYSDIVWSYPEPIPQCPKIKGYLCFFNEQVDAILVDGDEIPRPIAEWSRTGRKRRKTAPDQAGPVGPPRSQDDR